MKKENHSIRPLDAVDAISLMNMNLPPPRYVVEGLIPTGLTILGGDPKSGKSILALGISIDVANGTPVLNQPVTQGSTLYLCLEDTLSRVQDRLKTITDEPSEYAFYATQAMPLGQGLEEQIRGHMTKHPDTILIIIDVLQMIRPPDSDLSYANDYRDMLALKSLANEFDIAILVIHHLRKKKDDNRHHMHSGTTGLPGAADTSLVLEKREKGSPQAILSCIGRDIPERTLVLELSEDLTWELVGEEESTNVQSKGGSIVNAIVLYMQDKREFIGSAEQLAQALGSDGVDTFHSRSIGRVLNNRRDELLKCGISVHKWHRVGQKLIKLERIPNPAGFDSVVAIPLPGGAEIVDTVDTGAPVPS